MTQPSFSGLITVEEFPMSDGAFGTFEALEMMAAAVRGELPPDYSGWDDPQILAFALSLTRTTRTFREMAQDVFNYACSLEYRAHPDEVQIVQDAARTIQLGYADCVSLSILIATLEAALGMNVRFAAQYYSDSALFTHVYAEVWIKDKWIAQDAVAKNEPMGWTQKLPDGGFEHTKEIF